MPKQASKEVPLVCTSEVAKAVYDAHSTGRAVSSREEFVVAGASWQRRRIVDHLFLKLQELQTQLAQMNEVEVPGLITLRADLRGRLEGQIEVLQSLISELG